MANAVEIRFKTITGATGVEGIENDDKAIIRSKSLTMAQGRGCNQLRIAVIHARRDIDRILGIEDTHLGFLGSRGLVTRASLVEISDRCCQCPDVVIQQAVDYRCSLNSHSFYVFVGHAGVILRQGQCGHTEKQSCT